MEKNPVSVLFVCHANLCRSPMAERLAELALTRQSGDRRILVGSAGTHAHDGRPMHPYTRTVLAEYGADIHSFASRPVSESLLAASDLILTASREQRAYCARLAPMVLHRAFTLREFGRLCGAVDDIELPDVAQPDLRLLALVSAVRAARSGFQPVAAADDNLADPVTGSVDDFRTCATEIWSVLTTILDLIIVDPAGTGRPR